jgi:RNA polymerase sigma factor (sigma-70 family)
VIEMSDDAALAEALLRHGARGLEAVYTAYAPRLYTYALTMLRDPNTAQDVVHDALLIAAQSIGQLRDPSRLRPWLYAITRNECLRTVRGRKRFSTSDEVVDMADASIDLDAGLRRDEAAQLIAGAMAAMSPADRDVVALALQHDLDVEQISEASGASANTVHARLSRARTGLSDAVGALALYRSQRRCEELRAVIGDQPLTPLLRKRIQRHVKSCDECEQRRRVALAAMGPAMAAPFYVTPPDSLARRLLADWHGGQGQELARRAAPWDADGFPVPLDTRRDKRLGLALAAAAGVLVLVGVLALMLGGDRSDPSAQGVVAIPSSAAPSASASPQSAVSEEPSVVPEPTTPEPTQSMKVTTRPTPTVTVRPALPPASAPTRPTTRPNTPKASNTPTTPKPDNTPSPTRAPSTQPAPTPTKVPEPPVITSVTLVNEDRDADGNFTRCDAFRLTITASVTGSVEKVEALIEPASVVEPLTGDPQRATVTLPPGEYSVTVRANGPGGSVTKDAGSVLHICPG